MWVPEPRQFLSLPSSPSGCFLALFGAQLPGVEVGQSQPHPWEPVVLWGDRGLLGERGPGPTQGGLELALGYLNDSPKL